MSNRSRNDLNKTMARSVQSKTSTKTTGAKLSSRTTKESKISSSRTKQETIKESKSKNDSTNSIPDNIENKKAKKESLTLGKKEVKKPVKLASSIEKSVNGRASSPPSRRVSKTQFFPSKNNYKELLNHLDKFKDDASPRRSTQINNKKPSNKIIKPEEPKNDKRDEPISRSNSTLERPRTSTLTKGNIVNQNIAGPDVPKEVTNQAEDEISNVEEDDVDYEDDFDSYESDFESSSSSRSTIHNISDIPTEGDTSSSSSSNDNFDMNCSPSVDKEVEKKMDSGSFDLNELMKRKQELTDNQDNSKARSSDHNFRSNLTSLSDEGFEEAKSLQFLNFAGAREKHQRRKSLEIRRKRGKELMNMIKLDYVNLTIFDMPSVTYDDFIRNFGNANTIQIGVQTGEENVDDAVQTEDVETATKWIQMPPHISKSGTICYKHQRLGVGTDADEITEDTTTPAVNEAKLETFITATGDLILDILKEKKTFSDRIKSTSSENTLSKGFLEFKPPSEVLGKRTISFVSCCTRNPSIFLSVHVAGSDEDSSRSIVCLWNVKDVVPESYLVCYGTISSCCFGSDSNTVFAGLENGILIVWNLKEHSSLTKNIYTLAKGDILLRNPTFLTEIQSSHCCRVVDIQSILESNKYDLFDSEGEHAKQVCSLDHEGTIIVWSVIDKHQLDVHENRRAQREKLTLYKNFHISLRNLIPEMVDLFCTDMILTKTEPKRAFVATNYGNIVRCTLNKEKSNAKMHISDDSSSALCLSICPFSNMYFLAGFENGDVNLYSSENSRTLMTLSNKKCEFTTTSILEIQWSVDKPCTFYTKNDKNSIDVWNLSRSNVLPVESITFKESITCMKLSSTSSIVNEGELYMIISTANVIHVHLLNNNQKKTNLEDYHEEMKIFLNYVSRL